MKKFILMAAAVLMTATAASAQFQMGAKAGINVARLSNYQINDTNVKSRVGLTLGVFGVYDLSDSFGLSADVLYSAQGAVHKAKSGSVKVTTKLDYLNIPILANYYIIDGLSVKAGIQPGILLSAKAKTTGLEGGTITSDMKSNMQKFDFSIPVGVGYQLPLGIQLDARYAIGMSRVNKVKVANNAKNGVFSLTAGYLF